MRNLTSFLAVILFTLVISGCSSLGRLHAVPESMQDTAKIPGFSGIRYRLDSKEDSEAFAQEAINAGLKEFAYLGYQGIPKNPPPTHYLAVSGGGDNGAFTAGLLNGWSASGTRPEFKLVTGVSTGGLVAPFAFLGKDYDAVLKNSYTETEPRDILKPRWLLTALLSDALADNTPLWRKVRKEVTREMLDRIADEYKKGRLLLIGTTDLDDRTAVIWNMTKIASSQDPKALDLFHSIMIASAAVPGAFPPVMIDVEVDGKKYQEMHVDGGATSQVFVYPTTLRIKEISRQYDLNREKNLYVIRNDRLDPDWSETERAIVTIAGKSIQSLIHSQGIGDLYRIQSIARRDGLNFNLAFIPPEFNAPHKEEFDPEYMRALYQTGYDAALKGYDWHKAVPGF
jgi:predicted acylesterase/phospholipase RssA